MHAVLRALFVCILCLIFALPKAFAGLPTPELPDDLIWLNTSEPVKLSRMQGHFVVLHFGIYSAPNADLSVPDLKKLSAKYPGELVVIGVNSAKLFDDRALEDIRNSVARSSVGYPVAIDRDLTAWKEFKVYALPTVILIAPDGKVLFRKPGGDVFYYLDKLLAKYKKEYKAQLKGKQLLFGTKPATPKAEPNVETRSGGDTFDESKPAIDVTGTEPETPDAQFIKFDFDKFTGEKVRINREYSRRVGILKVKAVLPPKSHLLTTVKSFVRVFTKEGEVLGGLETPNSEVDIPINREILTGRLYVEAVWYYTREGGLSQFRGVLFEVPLAEYSKYEDIELNYNINNP